MILLLADTFRDWEARGRAACGTLFQPVTWGTAVWRGRQLRRAFAQARLVLGRRMYAAGIDDGWVGAQIASVDEQLAQARATGIATGPLEQERQRLLVRLADLALEDDAPLPGADAEYAAAREAQTCLARHDAAMAGHRSAS